MIWRYFVQVGDGTDALGDALGAAGLEGTAGRQRGELWDRAGDWGEFPSLERWGRGQQTLGVGMARRLQDFAGGAFFDDTSGVHHGDAIGDLGDHAEVVGDEEEAEF